MVNCVEHWDNASKTGVFQIERDVEICYFWNVMISPRNLYFKNQSPIFLANICVPAFWKHQIVFRMLLSQQQPWFSHSCRDTPGSPQSKRSAGRTDIGHSEQQNDLWELFLKINKYNCQIVTRKPVLSSSFFIARFSVRVAGAAAARDKAATFHDLPSHPSFC